MNKKKRAKEKSGYGIVHLSVVVALLYFLFQLLLIFSVTQLDGDCLFSFWLGSSHHYLSPYYVLLAAVSLLVLYAITKLSTQVYLSKKLSLKDAAYYLCFLVIVGLWINGLYGMWQTFEYEKGNISMEEYLGDDSEYSPYGYGAFEQIEMHQCKKFDNPL